MLILSGLFLWLVCSLEEQGYYSIYCYGFLRKAKTIGEKMNMSGFNVNLSNIEDFVKKKTKNLNSQKYAN